MQFNNLLILCRQHTKGLRVVLKPAILAKHVQVGHSISFYAINCNMYSVILFTLVPKNITVCVCLYDDLLVNVS